MTFETPCEDQKEIPTSREDIINVLEEQLERLSNSAKVARNTSELCIINTAMCETIKAMQEIKRDVLF